MLRPTVLIVLAAATLVVCGCKTGPLPSAEEKARALLSGQVDPEQKKVLDGILDEQKETGQTIDALAKEIARREAVAAEAAGPSPLQRDYNVARALLVSIRRAVNSEEYQPAAALLERLLATIQAMAAECPAGAIMQHLERASYALHGTSVGLEADIASGSLLAALDVALKTADAPVVPDLARDLEAAKAQVDGGEFAKARERVDEFIGTVRLHRTLVTLRRAAEGVRGARAAMDREAGPVVLAELDQLSELLNDFGKFLKAVAPLSAPAETGAKTEASAKGEEKPAEGAAAAEGETEEPAAPAEGESGKKPEAEAAAEPTT